MSGVRAGRAVTACAAQSARPVLEISGHVTIADPRVLLSPPSVLCLHNMIIIGTVIKIIHQVLAISHINDHHDTPPPPLWSAHDTGDAGVLHCLLLTPFTLSPDSWQDLPAPGQFQELISFSTLQQ